MLESLHIENIAVIKSVNIDFSQGFSALTGETGAGKSIIIDSINLLLGKKAEKELIRHGEKSCMVSGLFSSLSDSCIEILSDAGIYVDEDGKLLVQRIYL
jgi:DNA repair protein RecN (Recombination protein N)